MKRWHAVLTQQHSESRAEFNLVRQGYEVYLPRLRTTLRHARRVESVLRPLFPRYLFVALNPQRDGWRPILSTFGVASLVRFAETPADVPAALIDALRAREVDGVHAEAPAAASWKIGDKLRVFTGAFGDMVGKLESMSGFDRVALLLEVMGREVRVTLPADMLEKA
jgi:transcriptional antiterminator RfaH